jgi:hypothetical protein
MNSSCFDFLLELVKPSIQKNDTNMRASISSKDRLIITLRFLSTGESFRSLHYQFRVGVSTISNIVFETVSAIYENLKGIFLQVKYFK